jgi:CRP/FNR family transcriptional regulator, dissimilatory nitrate respiration regulator
MTNVNSGHAPVKASQRTVKDVEMTAYQMHVSDTTFRPQRARSTSADRTTALLRRHPLFAALDAEDFDQLLARARPIELDGRQLLFRHEEAATRFFVVLRGGLKLFRLTWDGSEKVLDSVRPGQSVGESVMFASDPRYHCYAESMERSEVLAFSSSHYRELMASRADYNQALLTWLADSLEGRMRDLEVMTTQNAKDRVINYLCQLLPDRNALRADIELPLPKALLASRLAMQPETFSRILSGLKKGGIIRVEKRRLLIDDVAAMLRCAE